MLERYDYLQAVTEDVRSYIEDNDIKLEDYADKFDLADKLNEELFCEDSVTGNASGSYYCNAWKAEEALCHNLELLTEALSEFGDDVSYLERGAEACDVTIRCYLLPEAIATVLDEMEDTSIELKFF